MHVVVLHSGVEGPLQAVSTQVLAGEDAEGLVVGIARGRPKRPHLGDRVDASLELLVNSQEVFLCDAESAQHIESFVPIFADIAENGLSEVLHHVLGLSLLAFLTAFVNFEVAIFGCLFW